MSCKTKQNPKQQTKPQTTPKHEKRKDKKQNKQTKQPPPPQKQRQLKEISLLFGVKALSILLKQTCVFYLHKNYTSFLSKKNLTQKREETP